MSGAAVQAVSAPSTAPGAGSGSTVADQMAGAQAALLSQLQVGAVPTVQEGLSPTDQVQSSAVMAALAAQLANPSGSTVAPAGYEPTLPNLPASPNGAQFTNTLGSQALAAASSMETGGPAALNPYVAAGVSPGSAYRVGDLSSSLSPATMQSLGFTLATNSGQTWWVGPDLIGSSAFSPVSGQ